MQQKDSIVLKKGIALYSSRRFIEVYCLEEQKTYLGITQSRHLEVIPGDQLSFKKNHTKDDGDVTITEIQARKNLLKRSYDKKTKTLAANLDELWLVTAPPPLFNPVAIDRTLAAAEEQNIPVRIIANKSDLSSFLNFKNTISIYDGIVRNVEFVSARHQAGLSNLKQESDQMKIVAITGVSGAGKSSIISALYPEFKTKAGLVSKKTGQGKQTTSAAKGYVIDSLAKENTTVIIDLPGIQNFGISHLDLVTISLSMPDIRKFANSCKFRNCQHIKEPNCAVLKALEDGTLTTSRYQSYVDMINELNRIKEF